MQSQSFGDRGKKIWASESPLAMYQVQELPGLPETLSQKKKKEKQNRRGLGAGDESVGKVPAEQV